MFEGKILLQSQDNGYALLVGRKAQPNDDKRFNTFFEIPTGAEIINESS